ncbi:MAG TPA: S41 family peptidase [Blastocatellia bacterium]|nr:S41 family peptidase [Blastocatellia bacterium]
MLSKYLFVLLAIVCLFAVSSTQAQNLSKEEVEQAINRISALIKDNYVFEEKGKKIADHIVQEYKQGKLGMVKTWDDFASLSTKILRDYSNDGHLYVRRDPYVVKELATSKNQVEKPESEDPFHYSEIARTNNFGFREVKVMPGNIGYIKLAEINISEKSLPTLFAAMQFVANTRALIIDLRDNGGGGSNIGPVIESFFLPKETALLEFRNRSGQVRVERAVVWLTEKRYDKPLYIIVNRKTASAAEALAFALQANKRAIIVGQPSAGAAHMNSWFAVNDEVFVSVSTAAPTLPGTEQSWEGKGVQPDFVTTEGEEMKFIEEQIRQR